MTLFEFSKHAAAVVLTLIAVLMLWAAAMEKGYSCPLWMTYKQAAELGGQVRKGEKGSLVVYADKITKEGKRDTAQAIRDVRVHLINYQDAFNPATWQPLLG